MALASSALAHRPARSRLPGEHVDDDRTALLQSIPCAPTSWRHGRRPARKKAERHRHDGERDTHAEAAASLRSKVVLSPPSVIHTLWELSLIRRMVFVAWA
jgi:hypothetical protein